ncbi:Ger(x)C family spore germination protein [Alicyclobacillus sp. ALC3]|nr:Ger(x)C family spore germination protein [Alicyclobacillus sp. ALC3]
MTTGCWDMVEPNQRALWVGSAVDAAPKGRVRLSGQILVPSAMAEGKQLGARTDIVKSATGANISDAMARLQQQVSRKTYLSHRLAWFVGEPMAKRGFKTLLDEFGRNPDSNLRTYILVVKGADGAEFLKGTTFLDGTATLSAVRTIRFGDFKEKAANLRFFAAESLKDGQRPLALAIEPRSASSSARSSSTGEPSPTEAPFYIRDIALFDKHGRLAGFLTDQQADTAAWVAGQLARESLTVYMPEGQGTVTLHLQHVHRHIDSLLQHGTILVRVSLSGTGLVIENNSSLDLSQPQNLHYVQRRFEESIAGQTRRVIAEVQQNYGTDIFGFGEDIHRRYPYPWRGLRGQWDEQFRQLKTDVKVKLSIRHQGQRGPGYVGNDENA